MKRFILGITACLLLFSCEKETVLRVDQTALSYADAAGSQTVTLTANKPWTAKADQSWCKISPSGGEGAASSKITITCDANTTYDARNCTVTFTCAELSKAVSVSQATNNGLIVSQTSYELTNAAQQVSIEVSTNVEFEVKSDSDWVQYIETKALSSKQIVLNVDENKTVDQREAKVTIKQKNGDLGGTITIRQEKGDYVEFEDTNFKAYCVEEFDTNGDGEISFEEAREITQIDVNEKNIKSLQGIEYMTNLQVLLCESNQLTSLDVSHNPALTKLDCYDNQLTDLNVSNNAALTWLDCMYNQLTSLDVSHNPALTNLLCYFNKLTNLDVSHNAALTVLYCGFNKLTGVDVSHNAALTVLECGSNKLTNLDISHNLALTWLDCYYNELTSLDVSHNPALTVLNCGDNPLTSLDVSNNPVLTRLSCCSNQLTSLDVSNNPALTRLWCEHNQLTSLDVSNHPALTWLECRFNQLTSLDVSNNPALTEVSCYNNQLTSLDVSNNPALTKLVCSFNQLTSLDVSHNPALTELSCHNNPYLTDIWLKTGQRINSFWYDSSIAEIKYKD